MLYNIHANLSFHYHAETQRKYHWNMPEFSIFLAPAGSVAFYTRLTGEE